MVTPGEDHPLKPFATQKAFHAWLDKNHAKAKGVWIKYAKKSSGIKTITYDEALEVCLCYGWIDGQGKGIDDIWFAQRYTPRGPRSKWSKINKENVARLIKQGKMQPAGQAAIDNAKRNGQWDAAYDSPKNATLHPDFAKALSKNRKAKAFFETLKGNNRYAILYRIQEAKKDETRARRIEKFVAMLEAGEKIYP